MKIKVIGHNGKIFFSAPDNNPWSAFFSELKKSGAQVVTNESGAKFDVLIANSHSKKSIRQCEKFEVAKENRILILWEPKEINGKLYKPSTLANYGQIFSPSLEWLEGNNVHKFNWPLGKSVQKIQSDQEWSKRKNKFVFIGSNKYSVSKGELYSLRRAVLKDAYIGKFIDVYGHNWNSNILYDFKCIISSLLKTNCRNYSLKSVRLFARNYSNYKGLTHNKQNTLNDYRFAIVIENSNNYISEKLFESLESLCIVVYVGANLTKNLDKNIAIQSEPDLRHISEKVRQIFSMSNPEQLSLMKNQHKEYLLINKKWDNYKVLKNLARDSVKLLNF